MGFLAGPEGFTAGFVLAAVGRLGLERAVAAALDVLSDGPFLSGILVDFFRYLDWRAAIVFLYVS